MARRTLAGLIAAALVAACAENPDNQGDISWTNADTGTEQVRQWIANTPTAEPSLAAPAKTSVAPVDAMVGPLEARLAENPDDVKGWSLLARSYAYLGRSGDAQRALARAVALGADADQLRAQLDAAQPAHPF